MKTTSRISMFLLAILLSVGASGQAFQEGASSIHLGYGVGNLSQSLFKTFEQNYTEYSYQGMGPFFAKYEYAASDKIGVGLNFAYIGAEVSYTDINVVTPSGDFYRESITWTSMSFLARLNIHFGDNEKFDPFWGVGMGYRTGTYVYDDNDPTYDNSDRLKSLIPFGFETTVGARFYFNDFIGLYAETGLAKAVFQGGISLKF